MGKLRLFTITSLGVVMTLLLLAATVGCGSSAMGAASRVAAAVGRSETFYQNEVKSYRFRIHGTWGPQMIPDLLGGDLHQRANIVTEIYHEGEVVLPDRIRMRSWTYHYYEGDEANKRLFKDCDDNIFLIVGAKEYQRNCGGPWIVAERDLSPVYPPAGHPSGVQDYWDKLKSLGSVRQGISEPVNGVLCDTFEAEFTDEDGRHHKVAVWISADDGLIHRLRDVHDMGTYDVTYYDINDPTIIIELPTTSQ